MIFVRADFTAIVNWDERVRGTDHIRLVVEGDAVKLEAIPGRLPEVLWIAGIIPAHDEHCHPDGPPASVYKHAISHLEVRLISNVVDDKTNLYGFAVGNTLQLWTTGTDRPSQRVLSGEILELVLHSVQLERPKRTRTPPREEETTDDVAT